MSSMYTIRLEQAGDEAGIRLVNETAFGRPDEAYLVALLRERGKVVLSLVAVVGEEQIVGHVLFTLAIVGDMCKGMGLGPVAVLPAYQNQGVGTDLIQEGLERCRTMGYKRVVVVGHPTYYPRFGFVPASRYGLFYNEDVPDEVFMALALEVGAYDECEGIVYYEPEFSDVS